MNRLLLTSALVVAGIMVTGSIAVRSAFGGTPVSVRGNITKVLPGPTLQAVSNQPVTVICNGETKTATTDSWGLYTVTFTGSGCTPGQAVMTRTSYDASILTRQVSVSSEYRATIDLRF